MNEFSPMSPTNLFCSSFDFELDSKWFEAQESFESIFEENSHEPFTPDHLPDDQTFLAQSQLLSAQPNLQSFLHGDFQPLPSLNSNQEHPFLASPFFKASIAQVQTDTKTDSMPENKKPKKASSNSSSRVEESSEHISDDVNMNKKERRKMLNRISARKSREKVKAKLDRFKALLEKVKATVEKHPSIFLDLLNSKEEDAHFIEKALLMSLEKISEQEQLLKKQ
ncbi:hypothetical protein PNK_0243 [Candidatus Protochlamydia naegleriophila]|uniref:BZIP domain-containing protein n=1 Tax=Candidatus Protochlamydia naegleriophila TaxID=389348 RepID=A0A0U5J7Z3_9BACT|nr:bZIP transcription factor [Candidatus Protochlamydia naegleriophila]CUI15880.1 hypothetical protein PNK_0243 [Candidatus Protochlamydia naegleriophila]